MNWWFIALIIIYLLNIGVSMGKHGEKKPDSKYNFWGTLFGSFIGGLIIYMAIKTGF